MYIPNVSRVQHRHACTHTSNGTALQPFGRSRPRRHKYSPSVVVPNFVCDMTHNMRVYSEQLEERWRVLEEEGTREPGVTPNVSPLLNPPSWYDPVRFRRAQAIAKRHFLSLNVAHFIGNILLIHLPDVLVPVLATGNSSSPFMVFKRILSTIVHIISWYDEDPFDPKSATFRSLLTVRRNCHLAVSRLMNVKYPRSGGRYWLSQFDMSMTQWSLIGIVAIRPKECGFYNATPEEFAEYYYFWRVIGHCVGIKEKYNTCLERPEDTEAFLTMCFERCYKVHLDRQCQLVKMGMDLTEGVFLALNSVVSTTLISYKSFMKMWYETLGVRHPIKLNTWRERLEYNLMKFLFTLLRFRLFYVLFSWLFFTLQALLFRRIEVVHAASEHAHKNVEYRLPLEVAAIVAADSPDKAKNQKQGKEEMMEAEDFVVVNNYFYKPNV